MKKRKLIPIFAVIIALMVTLLVCLTACNGAMSYWEGVCKFTFWENKGTQAIAQTHVYDMVKEHMDTPSENGKVKKTLVLGFDGTRAEALANIRMSGVKDDKGNDIYSGDNQNAKFSAMNHIIDELGGKAYIAYAGGEDGKNKDTNQATSTAPGWASITTGAWGVQNGVRDNGHIKNMDKKTFMLEYAMQGLDTVFMASWSEHYNTYMNEREYVKSNNIPMLYDHVENDLVLHRHLLEYVNESENTHIETDFKGNEIAISGNKDVIFAIYDWADHNGHGTGFTNDNNHYVMGVRYNDNCMYEVIKAVESRSTYENEDWLIILTADHGGMGTGHGMQKAEARTTFIVTNKPQLVKTSYYSNNYDGMKDNK